MAEATLNPDFSQVESDALQVTVNQRYPVLYSEKRPFFMEAGNLFDLAAVGDGLGNMVMPVHTRTVVDPQWGIRLTGEQGKGSFALLASADRSPGNPWGDGEVNPDLGRKATFWIGRGKLGLGNGQLHRPALQRPRVRRRNTTAPWPPTSPSAFSRTTR